MADFHKDDEVAYRAPGMSSPEYGKVTSRSGMSGLVYVLFDGDTSPKACHPEDLKKVTIS